MYLFRIRVENKTYPEESYMEYNPRVCVNWNDLILNDCFDLDAITYQVAWNAVSIMQYAWIKDKNWKKIFAWDYLQWGEVILRVDNNWTCFTISDWGKLSYNISKVLYCWMYEVIWNKYENPEIML